MYNEFVFENYRYDPARSILSLCYNYPGGPRFEEQLIFEFVPQQLSPAGGEVLDRIFRLILLLSGVSYYKAFVPRILTCRAGPRAGAVVSRGLAHTAGSDRGLYVSFVRM